MDPVPLRGACRHAACALPERALNSLVPGNAVAEDVHADWFGRPVIAQNKNSSQKKRLLLGQEHGEVGHELRDVADEDAQDARHDLGVKRCGVMRDDDVGEDGGIGGEVELDEAAVLVLPHEPAREQHGVRVVDGVLRETDADGRIGGAVDDDGDGQPPLACLDLALKDGGVAVVAHLTDGKTGDIFLFNILLECLGRLDHDQPPPRAYSSSYVN